MTTFKFVAGSVTESYSGGIPTTFLYDQNTGITTPIPGGTTELDFTGSATGSSYSDGVFGGTGNDILTGMDAGDAFRGGDGDDTISGAGGNDRLYGGRGANTIDGGSGTDLAEADFSDQTTAVVAVNGGVAGVTYSFTVDGKAYGSVTDVEMMIGLTGGSGNDRLGGVYFLTSNSPAITGGLGTDTAVVDLSADNLGSFSGGLGVGLIYNNSTGYSLTLTGVEVLEFTGNATGTGYVTGIVGGDGADILIGLDGNDVFTGGGGNDTLTGKGGNDSLFGGLGANTIDGGIGNDVANADFSDQSGAVVAENGGVAGVTYGFTVGGAAYGSVINVEMMTGLTGGKGNDRLGGAYTLANRHSTISGGDGTDTAVVDVAADNSGRFSGGLSAGLIYHNGTGYFVTLTDMEVLEFTGNATGTSYATGIVGGAGADILTGLDGKDTFTGGGGNDTITGGKGDDSLFGGTGANLIEGGEGYDIASADFSDQSGAVVAVNLGVASTKYDFTVAGAKFGFVRDVEMMTGLTGGTGNDRLGGVYTLISRSSTIAGGNGTDTAVVDLSADISGGLSGGLGAGLIYNQFSGFSLTLTVMEVLEFTGNATGTSYGAGIAGGTGIDILTGLDGNDTFSGLGGNDKISGVGGNDRLYGGLGANTIDGGAGYDVADADFSDQTGAVVAVNGGVAGVLYGFTVGGKAHGSVTNVEMMTGLTCGKGDDRLGGVYTVVDRSSTISGGIGTDTAVVDLSADTKGVFSGGLNAGLIYNNSSGYSLSLSGFEVLEYTGNGNNGSYGFGVYGGGGADILTGLGKADIFQGGGGNDRLRGNGGNDELYGGGGNDTAVFTGNFASYAVSFPGPDLVEVTGPDGKDTLRDIEIVAFDDGEAEVVGGTIGNAFTITAASLSAAEGQTGTAAYTFTVTRTGAGLIKQAIGWSVAGTAGAGTTPAAAADFDGGLLPSGTVIFAPGESSRNIVIAVKGDTTVENNERFAVTLTNAPIAATITPSTAEGTIINDDASLSIAALAANKAEGQSGSLALTFTVTRSGDTTVGHSAKFAVTGSGVAPANATDFAGGALPSGSVSFAAGETSKTVTVNVAGDTVAEADEGLTVTLSAPSTGATLGTAPATGTIVNDDALLSIAALAASKTEGIFGSTALTFTVTRSGDTTAGHSAKFAVTGSGVAPAAATDFAGGALPSGSVSFAAGETSKTVTVNVAGDTAVEADEGFTVTLSAPSTGSTLGTATAIGTIVNDDVPGTGMLSIARQQASRAEGQSGSTMFTFMVTRSGDKSGPATATWAVTGGAASGTVAANSADFIGGVLPSGVVSFAANETSKMVTANVAGDGAVELNESFTVSLANPVTGVTLGTAAATGVIFNDDTPGTGTLSIARAISQRAEGQSGTTPFTFIVTRGGDASGTASADWVVTGGGVPSTIGANAADFAGAVLPSGRVNFAAGQTSQTVTVNAAGDDTIELNDSFTVTLAAPQTGVGIGTATATGVILNDDFLPSGMISIAGLQASRGEGASGSSTFTFVVTRAGSIVGPANATWSVNGGGLASTVAANGADFTGGNLPSGTVSFAPGATSQVVSVQVAGDAAVELNESFTVTLSNVPTGVALGTATATGLIWNDDPAGTGTLSIARASAQKAEGASGTTAFTFTVTRSGDLTGLAGADWVASGGGVAATGAATGADFNGGQFPAGRVNFAAGQALQTVTVIVAADTAAELNDSFTVTLGNPRAGVALGTVAATGVILNDDFASTAANQTLTGTAGPDVFLLGGGLDSVTGGAGLDLFMFQPPAVGTAASNATTLQDFSRGAGEKLDLSAIDAIAGTLANDAFTFIGTAAFNGTAGQLRWEDQGTERMIQGNVNADTTADVTIFVKAAGPVDANWFAL